jgi:hypothetical protein
VPWKLWSCDLGSRRSSDVDFPVEIGLFGAFRNGVLQLDKRRWLRESAPVSEVTESHFTFVARRRSGCQVAGGSKSGTVSPVLYSSSLVLVDGRSLEHEW